MADDIIPMSTNIYSLLSENDNSSQIKKGKQKIINFFTDYKEYILFSILVFIIIYPYSFDFLHNFINYNDVLYTFIKTLSIIFIQFLTISSM
jgi:hypothetical protein